MKGNRIIERDSLLVLKNQLTLCKANCKMKLNT